MDVTDMCGDGALIRYVGVSLSKSPTQASKVMKMYFSHTRGYGRNVRLRQICAGGGTHH